MLRGDRLFALLGLGLLFHLLHWPGLLLDGLLRRAVSHEATLLELHSVRLQFLVAFLLALLHAVGARLDAEAADVATLKVLQSGEKALATVLQLDNRGGGLLLGADGLRLGRRRVGELVSEEGADIAVEALLLGEEWIIILGRLGRGHVEVVSEHVVEEALLLLGEGRVAGLRCRPLLVAVGVIDEGAKLLLLVALAGDGLLTRREDLREHAHLRLVVQREHRLVQ